MQEDTLIQRPDNNRKGNINLFDVQRYKNYNKVLRIEYNTLRSRLSWSHSREERRDIIKDKSHAIITTDTEKP